MWLPVEIELRAVWALFVSASLVLILTPVGIKLLKMMGVLDVPTDRSSHVHSTIRGIGVVQLVSLCLTLAIMGANRPAVIFAAVGFSLLGFVDDLWTLPVKSRLLAQLLLAVCTVGLLASPWSGSRWWTVGFGVLGVLIVVATVNATNFMDGINGLSLSHGSVWGMTYGFFFIIVGSPTWTVVSLALAGVSLGLLPWNWGTRAKVFLGDAGSYLLGALIATLILQLLILGVSPVVAVGPLVIYAADTGQTLLRRLKARVSLTQAHREHIYQRLATSPSRHPRVALTVTLFTAVCCLASALELMDVISSMAAILIIGALAVVYLRLPNMLVRR